MLAAISSSCLYPHIHLQFIHQFIHPSSHLAFIQPPMYIFFMFIQPLSYPNIIISLPKHILWLLGYTHDLMGLQLCHFYTLVNHPFFQQISPRCLPYATCCARCWWHSGGPDRRTSLSWRLYSG